MRRRQQGSVYVLTCITCIVMMTAILGMARFGRETGDYVRRSESADAVARTAADVLAERLRHIGRLQRMAREALDKGDVVTAKRCLIAAWKIVRWTTEPKKEDNPIWREADRVRILNGADRLLMQQPFGLFQQVEVDDVKKKLESLGDDTVLFWVAPGGSLSTGVIQVQVWQQDADRISRNVRSASSVYSPSRERRGANPGRGRGGGRSNPDPIVEDDWIGRLSQ